MLTAVILGNIPSFSSLIIIHIMTCYVLIMIMIWVFFYFNYNGALVLSGEKFTGTTPKQRDHTYTNKQMKLLCPVRVLKKHHHRSP